MVTCSYNVPGWAPADTIVVNVDNLANIRVWNSVQTGTYGTGMDRSIKLGARVDL